MVAFQVLGNDTVVTLCAQAGQLESNVMTPLLIHNILQSMDLLKNAVLVFNQRCLTGVTANVTRCRQLLDQSGATAAILAPYIGVETATAVLQEASNTGKSIRQIVLEQQLMPAEILEQGAGITSP